MEMQKYVKGDAVILATPTAFEAIYKAQGFSLLKTAKPTPKVVQKPDKGVEDNGKDGSDTGDNAKSAPAGKRTRAKS